MAYPKKKMLSKENILLFFAVTAAIVIVFAMLILGGASDGYIHYEGERMKMSEVEEILADELEIENPDMDLELNIYLDTDE